MDDLMASLTIEQNEAEPVLKQSEETKTPSAASQHKENKVLKKK